MITKSKPRLYLAGPWFTKQSAELMEQVRNIYYNVPEEERYFDVYFPMEHQFDTPKETYESNIREMRRATCMVALIDEKDVGTAFEIGFFNRHKGKKNLALMCKDVLGFNSKTNIMLAFNTDILITLDMWESIVRGREVKPYKMINTWEAKE